jgi:hypothetical protein
MNLLALALLLLALAGCSSSSPSTGHDCISGAYDLTYGPAREGDPCPDLSALHPHYTVTIEGSTARADAPAGATPDPGNTFDLNACTSHAAYTSTTPPAPGCAPDAFVYDFAYDPAGITGTYTYRGCRVNGAETSSITCTYPTTGTRSAAL